MGGIAEIRTRLRTVADSDKAAFFPRFFKAGPGEYAEGDKFLGVTVPNVRSVVKWNTDLPLTDIETLLTSEWHEERLTALLILVAQFAKGSEADRQAIYDFYLAHTGWINNWDLVDSSAEFIVGPYLENRPEKMEVLARLAASRVLWERRIAILATFDYIKKGRADEALIIAGQLLHDRHDLIQKAAGWMLRETGKRVDRGTLTAFLDKHAAVMPRTTLRYAIEHLSPEQREYYMGLKGVK
ncbi:MAG: DNA alkylation repair protein [Candidatus Saccharibacteria bacterium]